MSRKVVSPSGLAGPWAWEAPTAGLRCMSFGLAQGRFPPDRESTRRGGDRLGPDAHQRHTALLRDLGFLAGARAPFRIHRRLPHLWVYPERHGPLSRSGRGACHLCLARLRLLPLRRRYAISPKSQMLVCQCVTLYRLTWSSWIIINPCMPRRLQSLSALV